MKLLIKSITLFFGFAIFTASITASADREIGQCIAWLKQAEFKFGTSKEIPEKLFYGWIGVLAMKQNPPLSIKQIDDLASSSNPDLSSCDAFGLNVNHLTVLEYILLHEEENWADDKMQNCFGAFFILDKRAEKTNNKTLLTYLHFMGGRLGGIASYIGLDFQRDIILKGQSVAIEILSRSSGPLENNTVFLKALSDCSTFGIDSDYMKHIAGLKNK
jgi:hypothetical protein